MPSRALLSTCASRSVVDNCTVHTATILISVLEVQSSCSIHTAYTYIVDYKLPFSHVIDCSAQCECTGLEITEMLLYCLVVSGGNSVIAVHACPLAGAPPSVLQMLSHKSIA